MFEVDLSEFIPAVAGEAKERLLSLPASAYLGENPVSATLVIPGTADAKLERLETMRHPQDAKALRRARTLYSAWLAFYRGYNAEAQEMAVSLFEGIDKSEMKRLVPGDAGETDEAPALFQKLGASYLICCLARHGMHRYHTDAAVAFMKELMEGGTQIAQAATIDLSMYELSVGIMADIPPWIKEAQLGVGRVGDKLLFTGDGVLPQNLYAALLAAIQFKNYQGEYLKSLALIDTAEKVFGLHSVIIGEVYFALYRALNEDALGYPNEADKHLRRAVELVREDGLWQIVAEFSGGFGGRLLSLIEEMDPAGAEMCHKISDGFFDRIMRSHEDEKDKRGHQKLTEQEVAVMRLAAAGRSNKEIAAELHIGAETVKFHKRNASLKLGTRPRASTAEISEALERHRISAEWIS